MNGYSFLKPNNHFNENVFSEYENLVGFHIPPMCKRFASYFILGDETFSGLDFRLEGKNMVFPLASPRFRVDEERDISCEGFYDNQALINDWNIIAHTTEFIEHGLIRIGNIGMGGGLYLGIKPSNQDHIYVVVWDWEDSPVLLANDIFEFVSKIYIDEDKSNFELANIEEYHQLVKRWGSDYWELDDSKLKDGI